MPQLQTSKLQRFSLPSTKDLEKEEDKAYVEMDISKLRPADVMDVDRSATDIVAGVTLVASRIKSWNYTDEQGGALPVSIDTVKLLDIDDILYLSDQIPSPAEATLDSVQKKT